MSKSNNQTKPPSVKGEYTTAVYSAPSKTADIKEKIAPNRKVIPFVAHPLFQKVLECYYKPSNVYVDVDSILPEVANDIDEAMLRKNQFGLLAHKTHEGAITSILAIHLQKIQPSKGKIYWTHQPKLSCGGTPDICAFVDAGQHGLLPLVIIECGMDKTDKSGQLFAYVSNTLALSQPKWGPVLGIEIVNLSDRPIFNVTAYCKLQHVHTRTNGALGEAHLLYHPYNYREVAPLIRLLHMIQMWLDYTCLYDSEWHRPSYELPAKKSVVAIDLDKKRVYKLYDHRPTRNNPRTEKEWRRNPEYNQMIPGNEIVPITRDLTVLSYDFLPHGNVVTSQKFALVVHQLHELHKRNLCHGDIRMANIVFGETTAMLIDYDMAGEAGKTCYPDGYQAVDDTKRHDEAVEGNALEKAHDRYSMAWIMRQFKANGRDEEWKRICDLMESGDCDLGEVVRDLEGLGEIELTPPKEYSKILGTGSLF